MTEPNLIRLRLTTEETLAILEEENRQLGLGKTDFREPTLVRTRSQLHGRAELKGIQTSLRKSQVASALEFLAQENQQHRAIIASGERPAEYPYGDGFGLLGQAITRYEINRKILLAPRLAINNLSIYDHLEGYQIETIILVSDLNDERNLYSLPRLIKNNLNTPPGLLHSLANESTNQTLLYAIRAHSNTSEETKVLITMRYPDME